MYNLCCKASLQGLSHTSTATTINCSWWLCIQSELCTRIYFDLFNSLYMYFQHHCVSEKYNPLTLKKLIRCTNHYEVTKCIVDNKDHIPSILSEITDDDGAAVDLCTDLLTCAGLLCQIKRHHFFHTGQFLVRVIGVLKPQMEFYSLSLWICAVLQDSVKTRIGESHFRQLLGMLHSLQREGGQ